MYQYRYKDIDGTRRTIYDRILQELRKKEKAIEKELEAGVSYFDGTMELSEVIDRLFSLKRKWRDSTRWTTTRYLNILKESKLYHMPINRVKIADCKGYLIKLHDEEYAFGTISSIYTILKMAFQMACEDNAIVRNPCNFSLKSIIDDDTPKVMALTREQEESLFKFLRTDVIGQRHLDMLVDGHVGFLSVTRNGRPRTHAEYADAVRKLMTRYNELNDIKIDRCTPHVLRHTFSTKCIAAHMDVKTVQYLMGHSDVSTTLNIYTDNVFENEVSGMELLESSCN